jgi:acyl-CoA thioester hydrolase
MTVQPSSGQMDGREHVLPVRVYYEDTDFTGVVYHAAYARFCERGRTEFLRTIGVMHSELLAGESPTAFTVTRLVIDYRRAARIDDALEVRTLMDRAKGPRLFIRQRILRGPEIIIEAEVEVACIGLDGRAKRPPVSMMAALAPLLTVAP